jgi:hypothetical protein
VRAEDYDFDSALEEVAALRARLDDARPASV